MSSKQQLDSAMFERLLKRERNSRKEAERLLDKKSIELYDANQRLRALAEMLEHRVEEHIIDAKRALLIAQRLVDDARGCVLVADFG